jgi:cytochrome c-type biogenesis protein CcmH/NrfG
MEAMAEKTLPDYYGLLQVHPRASEVVIKKAFRTLMAGGAHPDAGGSPERARLLTEAYEVLSNPDKRRAYDLALLMSPPGISPATDTPSASGSPGAPSGAPSGAPPGAQVGAQARAEAKGQANVQAGLAGTTGWPILRAPLTRGAVIAGAIFLAGLIAGATGAALVLGIQRPEATAGGVGQDASYHLGAAFAQLENNRPDDAEQHLRQAAQLAPYDPAPWSALGTVLAQTGQGEAAYDAFQRALKLDGEYRPALVGLGRLHQSAQRFSAALEDYDAALKLADDADVRFRAGEVALAMGDKGRAIAEWQACLRHRGAPATLKERARRGLSDLGAWYDERTPD